MVASTSGTLILDTTYQFSNLRIENIWTALHSDLLGFGGIALEKPFGVATAQHV